MCRLIVAVFALAWLGALAVLAVGTWGLFGQAQDALSGVYLILLGLPWSLLGNAMPEALAPWFMVIAPLFTLIPMAALCRLWRRRRTQHLSGRRP